MKTPRDFQCDAITAIHSELERVRSTLLVLPVGGGKTMTFSCVARDYLEAGRGVLVVAHREELVAQAVATLDEVCAPAIAQIEMAERCAADTGRAPLVVASVQTLGRASRLARWRSNAFGLIIIDESHHATSAGYRAILDHFASARVLGVTATPDRLDGKALGRIFASVAYAMTIQEAISRGILCPLIQRRVEVEHLDLSRVRTVGGDLDEKQLQAALAEERVLHEIAVPLVELVGERPTIVFTAGVEQAKQLALVLNTYRRGRAVAVDGASSDDHRRDSLRDYRSGKIQFLVNCALFTEGSDAPHAAAIAMCRPTKSRALCTQCIGRGLRNPAGKRDCLVLDFVGNSGAHKLVSAFDVLGGDYDDEVRARAEKLADGAPDLDVLAALSEAEGWVARGDLP